MALKASTPANGPFLLTSLPWVNRHYDDDLWLELADRRAKERPEDALLVYRRLVMQTINCKNNYAYRRAIELLHKIGRLMKKQKRREEFINYVERLLHTHRGQRNFAKLVDQMMARYYQRFTS